ncbi:hypothetical protein V2I78_09875 [Pseudomonas viridiflava]|uniref:hypothetical protein n=1 Tax=Pseudomonas viridiflava TaxID=33069 RepID=UPI002ECEEE09|nr:hypothetical protein [Pseudomonas viridiflava]
MSPGGGVEGIYKIKRLLKASKGLGGNAFFIGLSIPKCWAVDSPSIGQLHPPVVASIGAAKGNSDRKVTYLNLADAYWGMSKKIEATENYKRYYKLILAAGKKINIPERVIARMADG